MTILKISSGGFDFSLISTGLDDRCNSIQATLKLLRENCDPKNYREATKMVESRLNERKEEVEARLSLNRYQDLESSVSSAKDSDLKKKLQTAISERDALKQQLSELNRELTQNKAIQSVLKIAHIEAKLVDLCGHFYGDERGLLDQAWKAHQRGRGTLEAYHTLEARRISLIDKKIVLQSLSNGIVVTDVHNALPLIIKHLELEHKTLQDILEFVRGLKTWCDGAPPKEKSSRMIASEKIFISSIKKENSLNLTGLNLCCLPKEIGQLVHLEKLYLNRCPLQNLLKEIGQLKNLKQLYLNRCQLQDLPKELGQLVNLEVLFIEDNQLQTLPEGFHGLVNLRCFFASGNQLRILPKDLARLPVGSSLDARENPLSIEAVEIFQNEIILQKQLDPRFGPRFNFISPGLDEEIFEKLKTWFNEVCPEGVAVRKAAAEKIFAAYKIKAVRLDLSGMGLFSLPEGITFFRSLEEFNIANNQLQVLPLSLANLPLNCVINAQGNPLSAKAISIFQNEIESRRLLNKKRKPFEKVGPRLVCSIPEAGSAEATIIKEDLDPRIIQLTSRLLEGGPSFVAEEERDRNRDTRHGQTIAKMQGCSSFCHKILSCTADTPSVLSPQYLRNWQEQNQLPNRSSYNNTYLSLKYKRIGHVFSLEGMIDLPYQDCVSLEGANETFLFPPFLAAFNQFASSRTDLISDEMRSSIADSLSKAVWHENATEEKIEQIHANIHDPTFCNSIVVGGGHTWHSIQFIFHKTSSGEIILFCCNRGEGADNYPGIVIVKVKNRQAITKDFISRLVRRLSVVRGRHLSLEKIQAELQGVQIQIAYMRMKEGKVGNCVYSNYKATLYALLLIEILKEDLKIPNFNFPSEKVESAQQIYKEFVRFDASAVLEDFLLDLKNPPSKQSLEGENTAYWKGLKKVTEILYAKLTCYSKSNDLGQHSAKVSSELLQKARKNIEHFLEAFSS